MPIIDIVSYHANGGPFKAYHQEKNKTWKIIASSTDRQFLVDAMHGYASGAYIILGPLDNNAISRLVTLKDNLDLAPEEIISRALDLYMVAIVGRKSGWELKLHKNDRSEPSLPVDFE